MRSNSDAEAFVRALAEADIPYHSMSARGLYKKPVILDLTAYLRVITNQFDTNALWRVLTAPFVSLGSTALSLLTESFHKRLDRGLFETLRVEAQNRIFPDDARAALEQLLGWIERSAVEAREKPAGTVLLNFLERSGLLQTLTADEKPEHLAQLVDLRQFFAVIDRFQRVARDGSVRALVEFLILSLAAGDEGALEIDALEGPDAVRILTVHSAKGLEFAHVFLVHLVDRRFPTNERADALELPDALLSGITLQNGMPSARDLHLQEERRLFYVGMTRAKQGLYCTSAEDYGGARKKKLSRFLFEAGFARADAPPTPTGRTRFDSPATQSRGSLDQSRDKNIGQRPQLLVPDVFSYTQLKAYETCPLQYKFAHVLRLPRRGSASLSFGQTIHKTLENFFRLAREGAQTALFESAPNADTATTLPVTSTMRVPSLATLLRLYEQCWIPEWYASAADANLHRRRGQEMLEGFYARHEQKGWPNIWAIEKPFLMTIGDIRFKGKIDRLDLSSEASAKENVLEPAAVEVVDYKTGRSPKEDDDVDREQLLLYQLAVSEVFGASALKLSYYFLEDGKIVSFLGAPAELETLKDKIVARVSQIRQGKFPATPGQHVCTFCDFKEICEYRIL